MPGKLQGISPALWLLGVLTLLWCPPALCGCSFPPSIAHGRHTQVKSYNIFKYEVIYECDEGYILVGQAKLSCTLCLKPEIENGNLSMNKDQYVETENFTVHCDSGFAVVGPQSITCSENGTWYPQVPKCVWEVLEGCEQVLKGRKLTQCLPDPDAVKMALEVYKLSLEIALLELERDKWEDAS
uniref:Sushi domain-containing protein n=1 Tax=Castor canadensis TaxID=51338 RepID=A0A8C0XRM5_CASCN